MAGLEELEEPEEQQKRGTMGLKQQQENKMQSQHTSSSSVASSVLAASQATIPAAVGQVEEPCTSQQWQCLADTDVHWSGCSSVSSMTGCDSECLRGANQMGKMLPFRCLEMEPRFNIEACFNSPRCFADTTAPTGQ